VSAALAAGAVLAGCGVDMPDTLALRRTGTIPGARLALAVNDGGTVRCNRGRERPLPSSLLLDARGFVRDVEDDLAAHRRFPPRPGSVLAYAVRTADGSVAWSDTSRPLPAPYYRFALLARRIAKGVCHLPR
jgi:hypothetical protein